MPRGSFCKSEPELRLPDIALDLPAAAAVASCEAAGIRAYAQAGGLDPATDFRGLDLSGMPLAGQRLSGFDFSLCDLRGTGIERAIVDSTFVFVGAILDPGIVPGSDPEIGEFGGVSLWQILDWTDELYLRGDWTALVAFGATLLPILESEAESDDRVAEVLARMALRTAWGELFSYEPAKALTRADRLLKRGRGQRDWNTLDASYCRGRALRNLGRYREALAEFNILLPLNIKVKGSQHLDTLNARRWQAQVLQDLGRYREALDEFERLLPFDIKVRGSRDPGTLEAFAARANVLHDLGRYREALDELDRLLPLSLEVEGPHHPGTLTTRACRASVLQDLGRYREAFDEFDCLLPLFMERIGPRDYNTLATRFYRACLLHKNGRVDEAVAESTELIALWENEIDRAMARSLLCGILIASQRDVAQVGKLRDVVETLARARSPNHLLTLQARYRLARALFATRERDADRAEIVATIADFHPATDPCETYLAASKRLLAVIDGLDDGKSLPE